MRFTFIAVTLTLVAILAGRPYYPWATNIQPPSVAVAPTSTGENLERAIFANGVVEGRHREAALHFELTGRLEKILVEDGKQVKAGDILASLDGSTWRHELAQAEARLALARVEKEKLLNGQRRETRNVAEAEVKVAGVKSRQADANFQRFDRLAKSNAISRQEFEDKETEHLRSEAELELARARAAEIKAEARADDIKICDAKIALEEAQVANARSMLTKTELRAPCDGVVLQVFAEVGELVSVQSRTAILTMVDASERRVRAFVEELDAVRVREGMQVRVSADGLPGRSFRGHVLACSPTMVPKRHMSNEPSERIDVKVREVIIVLDPSDNPETLVVGLPLDVYFQAADPIPAIDPTVNPT